MTTVCHIFENPYLIILLIKIIYCILKGKEDSTEQKIWKKTNDNKI